MTFCLILVVCMITKVIKSFQKGFINQGGLFFWADASGLTVIVQKKTFTIYANSCVSVFDLFTRFFYIQIHFHFKQSLPFSHGSFKVFIRFSQHFYSCQNKIKHRSFNRYSFNKFNKIKYASDANFLITTGIFILFLI